MQIFLKVIAYSENKNENMRVFMFLCTSNTLTLELLLYQVT